MASLENPQLSDTDLPPSHNCLLAGVVFPGYPTLTPTLGKPEILQTLLIAFLSDCVALDPDQRVFVLVNSLMTVNSRNHGRQGCNPTSAKFSQPSVSCQEHHSIPYSRTLSNTLASTGDTFKRKATETQHRSGNACTGWLVERTCLLAQKNRATLVGISWCQPPVHHSALGKGDCRHTVSLGLGR